MKDGLRRLNISDYINHNEKKLNLSQMPLVDFVEIKNPQNVPPQIIAKSKALYEYLFPNQDERTPWGSIISALIKIAQMDEIAEYKKKYDTRRYHVILGLRGEDPVTFNMFCTLPFSKNQVVAFGLYAGNADAEYMMKTYSKDENYRGKGLLHMMRIVVGGVIYEDAEKMNRIGGIVGGLGECEFIGQARDIEGIKRTKTRLIIQQHSNVLPIMLYGKNGEILTPLIQPRLSENSEPLLMHLLYRPINNLELKSPIIIDMQIVRQLMLSYLYNYETPPYDLQHVSEIKKIVEKRISEASYAKLVTTDQMPDLITLAQMDTLLAAQIERDYGSLREHKKKILEALYQ